MLMWCVWGRGAEWGVWGREILHWKLFCAMANTQQRLQLRWWWWLWCDGGGVRCMCIRKYFVYGSKTYSTLSTASGAALSHLCDGNQVNVLELHYSYRMLTPHPPPHPLDAYFCCLVSFRWKMQETISEGGCRWIVFGDFLKFPNDTQTHTHTLRWSWDLSVRWDEEK